jgi:hypothetical protein
MEAAISFDMSITVYQSTRHHTPEELNFQQHRSWNLITLPEMFIYELYAQNTVTQTEQVNVVVTA